MDEAEASKLLESGEYGILSTVGADGYAYGIPLSYVFMNNAIYFHGTFKGHKYDNIENNNRVSFCVVGETEILPSEFSVNYQSVIVFGIMVEVQGEEKSDALLGFVEKYSMQYREEGKQYLESDGKITKVMKINIEYISGKVRH